jgi:hypothetical protein
MMTAKELSKYKLAFLGVLDVRSDRSDTEKAGENILFCRKRNEKHESGTDVLCIRESYQQLRGLSLLVTGCHT